MTLAGRLHNLLNCFASSQPRRASESNRPKRLCRPSQPNKINNLSENLHFGLSKPVFLHLDTQKNTYIKTKLPVNADKRGIFSNIFTGPQNFTKWHQTALPDQIAPNSRMDG
jgi:hypothetical protein